MWGNDWRLAPFTVLHTHTKQSQSIYQPPLFMDLCHEKKKQLKLCYSTRSNTLRTSGTFPLDLQTHTFFPLTSQHHHFLYDTDSEVLQPIRLDLFRQWSESDIVIETALLLSLKRSLDHIQFVALQKDFHQTVFQKKRNIDWLSVSCTGALSDVQHAQWPQTGGGGGLNAQVFRFPSF